MKIMTAKIIKALLPHGLVVLHEMRKEMRKRRVHRDLARVRLEPFNANAILRDRHLNQRCFILCSGPSVRHQDLQRLAGELVISVSSAYLHSQYHIFKPAYHCVPQITFGAIKREDVASWFIDMDTKLGNAVVVLSDTERTLIGEYELFRQRAVHHLFMEGDAAYLGRPLIPDLTEQLPSPQSVSIMALMLALYMGCREIYLLGTDHNQFATGTYTHFYERAVLDGKDPSVGERGKIITSRYEEFKALGRLWQQYRWLRTCAASVDAKIFNATAGGGLDEFERVDYSTMRLAGDKIADKEMA